MTNNKNKMTTQHLNQQQQHKCKNTNAKQKQNHATHHYDETSSDKKWCAIISFEQWWSYMAHQKVFELSSIRHPSWQLA